MHEVPVVNPLTRCPSRGWAGRPDPLRRDAVGPGPGRALSGRVAGRSAGPFLGAGAVRCGHGGEVIPGTHGHGSVRARGQGLSPPAPERSTVWSGGQGGSAAGEGMPQAYRGCHKLATLQIALCSLAMAVALTVTLACILVTVALAAVFNTRRSRPRWLPEPPGPVAWPIIGNLHLLGNHRSPFEAFSALGKRFGDIYQLKMGTVPAVVLNNYAHIKEVLITRGADFGGRPDFLRFHKLFGGDRNNCECCVTSDVILCSANK